MFFKQFQPMGQRFSHQLANVSNISSSWSPLPLLLQLFDVAKYVVPAAGISTLTVALWVKKPLKQKSMEVNIAKTMLYATAKQ